MKKGRWKRGVTKRKKKKVQKSLLESGKTPVSSGGGGNVVWAKAEVFRKGSAPGEVGGRDLVVGHEKRRKSKVNDRENKTKAARPALE